MAVTRAVARWSSSWLCRQALKENAKSAASAQSRTAWLSALACSRNAQPRGGGSDSSSTGAASSPAAAATPVIHHPVRQASLAHPVHALSAVPASTAQVGARAANNAAYAAHGMGSGRQGATVCGGI